MSDNIALNPKIFLDDSAWSLEWDKQQQVITKRCSRCLYDSTVPNIVFDGQGVCNYCHDIDVVSEKFPGGSQGEQEFGKVVAKIKRDGKGKKYDVIIGVSGGADSSYLVHLAIQYGLRPLAVHYDNTWNSSIAVENIRNVLDKLGVELWTHVVDNEEYDDLYKAIIRAGSPDLEAPTDLALASTINIAAAKHKVKYVLEGHSFRTEGMSPLGWLYMDAKYIDSMHKAHGTLKKLKSYPHMWFRRQLKWMLFNRLKKIRPLWYLDYDKEKTKKMLEKEYGWKWYGGHHLENRITAFYHTYFLPRRFGFDQRKNGYAALVRSGQMSREEGLDILSKPPECDMNLVNMVRKRWGLENDSEWLELMTGPIRYYTEFKTYKPMFERLRPFFYVMAKFELIPWSFYMKYTKKS